MKSNLRNTARKSGFCPRRTLACPCPGSPNSSTSTRDTESFTDLDFVDVGVQQIFEDSDYEGSNVAGFGQATYRLFGERLGLTAGLRVERVKRTLERDDDVVVVDGDSIVENEVLPRFVIDYRLTDSVMAYASLAKGWRNGGLNPTSSTPINLRYDREIAWNYELGLKSKFFQDRLLFNISLFQTNIDDYQETVTENLILSFLGNAEEVRIRGLEVEMEALPFQGLYLLASFGLADAEYEDYQFSETINLAGNTVADVPEWEFTAVAQYTLPIGFYVRGDFFAVGETFFDPQNTVQQDSYEVYNARVGFQRGNYDFYVFGENLADNQYFVDGFDAGGGLAIGPVGTSRRIGGGISLRF